MRSVVARVLGALLALLGLAAAVLGGWLIASLGSSGTATFEAEPGAEVIVLTPQVLNRVDAPVEVSATATGQTRLWAATARPSDVEALIGEAPRTQVDGVDVRDWRLRTTAAGEGESLDPRGLDIWQRSAGGDGSVTMTIDQAQAPQSLVISAPEGEVSSVTMQVSDDGWYTRALVLTVLGVLALLGGLALLYRSLRGGRGRSDDRRPSITPDPQDAPDTQEVSA